jgi:hypothetical protein
VNDGFWETASFAVSASFLGKLAGQPAGLTLSISSTANMNEWQKVGSRKGAANDWMWVLPAVNQTGG